MSYVSLATRQLWYLSFPVDNLRNNSTSFMIGDSGGSAGYKFDRTGTMTKLSVFGELTGITGGGTYTITVTIFKDGITATDKVFELTFPMVAVAAFGSTDEVPDPSGPGADYGTGSDIFVKINGTLSGGAATGSATFGIILEGIHNA